MDTAALDGGFGEAPADAARGFRAVMRAMARPGTRSDFVIRFRRPAGPGKASVLSAGCAPPDTAAENPKTAVRAAKSC